MTILWGCRSTCLRAVVTVDRTCIIRLSCDCVVRTNQAPSLLVHDSAKAILCHLSWLCISWMGFWLTPGTGGFCLFADDVVLFHSDVISAVWSSSLFKEIGMKIGPYRSEAVVLLCKNVYWCMKWSTKLTGGSVRWPAWRMLMQVLKDHFNKEATLL